MSAVHPCFCGGVVSSEFGCSHFGAFQSGKHFRHALCCAYFERYGVPPRDRVLLTGYKP